MVMACEFGVTEPSARELRQAIEYFKLKDGAIDKAAPVEFLTPDERQAVSRDGRFSVSLYKALLFLQVQSGIKSGTLNLEHSYKYRPLDAYLIDRGRWQRGRTLLIERAGLQAFVDPHRVLAELDEALYRHHSPGWLGRSASDRHRPAADHLFAERKKRFAQKFFVNERTVDLCSIEKGNAKLHCFADQRDHCIPVRGGAAMVTHAHAAEPDS
jgi:hypothetical protein